MAGRLCRLGTHILGAADVIDGKRNAIGGEIVVKDRGSVEPDPAASSDGERP